MRQNHNYPSAISLLTPPRMFVLRCRSAVGGPTSFGPTDAIIYHIHILTHFRNDTDPMCSKNLNKQGAEIWSEMNTTVKKPHAVLVLSALLLTDSISSLGRKQRRITSLIMQTSYEAVLQLPIMKSDIQQDCKLVSSGWRKDPSRHT